jgi:hypothetical protein
LAQGPASGRTEEVSSLLGVLDVKHPQEVCRLNLSYIMHYICCARYHLRECTRNDDREYVMQ